MAFELINFDHFMNGLWKVLSIGILLSWTLEIYLLNTAVIQLTQFVMWGWAVREEWSHWTDFYRFSQLWKSCWRSSGMEKIGYGLTDQHLDGLAQDSSNPNSLAMEVE